jgi:hypothetical protein
MKPDHGCSMMSFFPRSFLMIMIGLFTVTACGLSPTAGALAKSRKPKPAAEQPSDDSDAKTEAKTGKHDKKHKNTESKSGEAGKTLKLGTFGEWGAYQTQGKAKTCYALAKPKTREPKSMKREPAYIFISTRPAENVKNEISVIMGFPMKDGSEPSAEIGSATFALLAKGSDAWVKNPAEESHFIGAMKKGAKLVVKADSTKGKTTTDTYSLAGLAQALEKVHKECP